MKNCIQCKSISNFVCECSAESVNLCKYHITDHLSHHQLRFTFSNDLKKDLENVLNFIKERKLEITEIKNSLVESEKKLISIVKQTFFDIRLKASQITKDLDESVLFLENLRKNEKYLYFNIVKFLLDPQMLQRNSLIQFQNKTSSLYRKIPTLINLKSFTENLLKIDENLLFDKEFFDYEIGMARLREQGLKKSD